MSVAAKAKAPKRVRCESVTTWLGRLIAKEALLHWTEREAITGMQILARAGEPIADMTYDELQEALRTGGVGPHAVRTSAARRGVNVHALVEDYMRTGKLPDPVGKVDPEDYGFVAALNRWIMDTDPEPVAIEQLVCDPERKLAGRLDLRARFKQRGLETIDFATSEKAAIWPAKHVQVATYEGCERACGGEPADGLRVVVFAKDGSYREMPFAGTERSVRRAFDWWDELLPIMQACDSANRAEKQVRTEPAEKREAIKVEYDPDDRSTHPGAMEEVKERVLPDGTLLTYEAAPVGWATKQGTRRQKDWRAYFIQRPVQGALDIAA